MSNLDSWILNENIEINSKDSTFEKGFNWLKSCENIEEWKTEKSESNFKNYFNENVKNKHLPISSDIKTYSSNVHGIFMHHILENENEWKQIFINALNSFTEKLCLVIFTPFNSNTISFSKDDLRSLIAQNNCVFTYEALKLNDESGIEHIFYITKKNFLAYYTGFCGTNSNISNQIPPIPSEIYDCYYYTNNLDMYESLKDTKWIRRFIYIEPAEDFNTANFHAKHIKVCPHSYPDLQKYTYLLWLDSKLGKLNEAVVSEVISNMSLENDMILRKHPWSGPYIWLEIDASLKQERYKPLSEQMHNYIHGQLKKGLSEYSSFHATCSIIIRKMNENCKNINEEWYKHILECGIQDQVSFFFVKQLFSRINVVVVDIIKEKKTYDF